MLLLIHFKKLINYIEKKTFHKLSTWKNSFNEINNLTGIVFLLSKQGISIKV